jgi:uncharacterized protein (UPF0264 family)
VLLFARAAGWGTVLVDTWHKDGTTLFDWLALPQIVHFCGRCRNAGMRVALAGSLGPAQILALRCVAPDWIAVRGAVCRGGMRGEAIDPAAVRALVRLLASPVRAAIRAN